MDSQIDKIFSTDVYSVESLGDTRFLVPTYQRPYVWQNEHVLKLLDDFWAVFTNNENKTYFIGTIMTSIQEDKEELIDGQQRFTTLWLIALAFKKIGVASGITDFLICGKELRFDFAIRVRLKNYLTQLLTDKKASLQNFSIDDIESDDYVVNIAKAITTIENHLDYFQKNDNGFSIEDFGDFIYKQVKFVKNTAPANTKLNKLFATINNSGVQLEQTDILKAQLLKRITTEKDKYSRIWEACENMENYFERNVKKLFHESQWADISADDFRKFDANKFLFQRENDFMNYGKGRSLAQIINEAAVFNSKEPNKTKTEFAADNDTEDVIYCESIITFGQLLLHTYRIFIFNRREADFNQPFHTHNLLTIFNSLEKRSEYEIKSFFECLWEVRFLFDKHVVKWISKPGEKEKNLVLTGVSKDTNKNQFSRYNKEKDELSMLQSVLYFTTNYNTQIWLTPFLKLMIDNEQVLPTLEKLDNDLSLTSLDDKKASYLFMDKHALNEKEKKIFRDYLTKPLGTGFNRYWFQKLEYILWKNWGIKDPRFDNYRITSKNSIEHISPQHPEFGETLDDDDLNSFGNLALLNVSQNSSYSNQYVSKKKIDFDNKNVFDSLKLYFVYTANTTGLWGPKEIEDHEADMIRRIENHYNNTSI